MVKILLLKPPQTYIEGTLTGRPCLPFGLLYLAGSIEEANHNASIRDLLMEGENQTIPTGKKSSVVNKRYLKRGLNDNQTIKIIKEEKPDLIGITCISMLQEKDSKDLSKLIKQNFPEIPLVVGGTHATLNKEHMFFDSSFDYLIAGEGEKTIVSLIDSIFNKKEISEIPGLNYKFNGIIKQNKATLKSYLTYDSLPLPRYNKIKDIFNPLYDHTQIESKTDKPLGIFFSRGCGRCKHCSSGQSPYKGASIENVLNLFNNLKDDSLDPKEIIVQDDDFFRNPQFVNQMINFFNNRGLFWNVEGGIIIQHLINNGKVDHKLIENLARSGLYRAYIPIENINPASSQSMGRNYHNLSHKLIFELFDSLKNNNIQADTAFILGTLNENKLDILKTVEFAKNLKSHTLGYIGLFSFKIFPGLEKYFKSKGYEFELLGGPQEVAFDCFNIKTKNLNPLELNILREEWYREVNGTQFDIHLEGYWPGRTTYEEFKKWKVYKEIKTK